jgi:hypothetical protein
MAEFFWYPEFPCFPIVTAVEQEITPTNPKSPNMPGRTMPVFYVLAHNEMEVLA